MPSCKIRSRFALLETVGFQPSMNKEIGFAWQYWEYPLYFLFLKIYFVCPRSALPRGAWREQNTTLFNLKDPAYGNSLNLISSPKDIIFTKKGVFKN